MRSKVKGTRQRFLVTVSWVECNETQQRKAALLNSNALKAQQVISESFNTKHGLELESYKKSSILATTSAILRAWLRRLILINENVLQTFKCPLYRLQHTSSLCIYINTG